jgi:hypothetical protein
MDLQTFVTRTLKEVIEGIRDAQKEGIRVSAASAEDVDFDVAVTVNEASDKKGGGGLFVAGFGVGAQGSSSLSNSTVSRIKFKVPVFFPDDPSR